MTPTKDSLKAALGAATKCLATADGARCFFKLRWTTSKPKGVDEFGREAVQGLTEAAKLVAQARECLTFAVNAAIAQANPGPCYVWNDMRYATAHQAAVYVLRGVLACACEALIETVDAETVLERLPDQQGEWFLCPDRIAAAFGGFTGDPQALWQAVHDHLDALPWWDIQGADIMREAVNAIAAAESLAGTQDGQIQTPPPENLTKEQKALALLVAHPTWSDTKIAEEVPCSRSNLYRWATYQKAREALEQGRHDRPRGTKDRDGNLDAW